MIDPFEPNNTILFTFVSSVAPDSSPILKVTGIGGGVSSFTSISSDSTHYYMPYVIPTSEGVYLGEWYAEKTIVGSAYPYTKKFLFQSRATRQV